MDWEKFRLSTRLNLQTDIIEKVYATLTNIDAVKNSWTITPCDRLNCRRRSSSQLNTPQPLWLLWLISFQSNSFFISSS